MRTRLLVTGGSGFLGRWVVRLTRANWSVTATYCSHPVEGYDDWRQLDVRDRAAVLTLVQEMRPTVIIHTAALNPGQGSDLVSVNGSGTRNVAQAAARVDARLIHLSSDVVFDGKRGNYDEEDSLSPVTPYGRSKALAEDAVRESGARSVIVRTSLIYGPAAIALDKPEGGASWHSWDRQTRWVIGDLRDGRPVRLFTDERRCPIWVESLACAVAELAARSELQTSRALVLHVAGGQSLSRYAFGLRLARFHGQPLSGIEPTLSRNSGLIRPLDCTLDCSLAEDLLHTPLPGVDEVLSAQASAAETPS